MITFWSPLRGGWGRRGAPWSLPCPESPTPGRTGSRTSRRSATNASAARKTGGSAPHRRCWPRSRRCGRRSGIAGCGKRAAPRLGLVRQSPREFAGVCGRARAGRRGVGGSEAAVPASALRGSLRTQEGAARERAGRAGREGRCEVRAPAQRLPLAGARRSSNKFCVSAIHSSHYRCTNQRRPSGPGAGLALKVVPGPGCAGLATDPRYSESRLWRWGCALGAPGWGGREQRTTAGAGLCPPFSIHTVSNSPPPTGASATCRVGRGGEVGGELCGAHRQWGRLAEPRDSPGKVAKCRLCRSPVRCPREPALGSLRCDRRGQTQSEVVSRSQDWLAASRVAHRPRLPVFCLWLHREKATHTRPLSGDTLGEPGAEAARRENAEPREERRAKRTQWGSDTLRRPQARRPRPWKARSWTP